MRTLSYSPGEQRGARRKKNSSSNSNLCIVYNNFFFPHTRIHASIDYSIDEKKIYYSIPAAARRFFIPRWYGGREKFFFYSRDFMRTVHMHNSVYTYTYM